MLTRFAMATTTTNNQQQDQPLSYLGVNVRRAPTPLPGGEAAAAASFMRGAGAGAGGGGGGGGGSAAAWDPNSTLQWSNRGISTQKMPLLREVLSQSPRLVRLCLGGNKLCNEVRGNGGGGRVGACASRRCGCCSCLKRETAACVSPQPACA